jgi:uncharacterized protein with GYD domain
VGGTARDRGGRRSPHCHEGFGGRGPGLTIRGSRLGKNGSSPGDTGFGQRGPACVPALLPGGIIPEPFRHATEKWEARSKASPGTPSPPDRDDSGNTIPPHTSVSPGGGTTLATFITTIQFTEQGIKAVRDTCDRAAAFKATAKKLGVKVTGLYWTLGAFDGVVVCEAPDEEAATAALLRLGSLGNVRTQTARAFDAAGMQKILGLLPR